VSYSEGVARKLEDLGEWLKAKGVTITVEEEANSHDRFDDLTKIHEREGRAISSLMTRFRLTPQSRYDTTSAHNAVKRTASKARPWEAGGE
jgi:hypothetical protein